MKTYEKVALLWVLCNGILWDGFGASSSYPTDRTESHLATAMVQAIKQYDPFQWAPRDLSLPIEVVDMISSANDQAIDALPI